MKSQRINRKNINSFCRTCLTEISKLSVTKSQKFNVYLTPCIPKWIHSCFSLEVNKTDGHPKFICQKCYTNVQNFYEFREMTIRSKQTIDCLLNEVLCEPEMQKESTETKEELCNYDDDIDNCKTEHEDSYECKNDDWTEYEIDDKSLIAPLLVTNLQLDDFKEESIDSKLNETCKKNVENNDVFEYQNCPQLTIEGNNEKPTSTSDGLNDEIKANISDDTDSLSDRANDSDLPNSPEETKLPLLPLEEMAKEKQKFLCTQCSRRCINQQNLDRHMRIHQGLKLFQCNECDRGFNKRSRLTDHVRRIHENHVDEEFPCTYEGCDKLFRKKESWRMHYRKKHTNYEETRQTYMCETCGSSFKNANSLKKHRFKHGPEEAYPFQCKQCGKRFLAKCKLQEHEMRHAGIKKFECPHCGMKKTTRNELRMHMNYHTKEKQWYCQYCNKVFNSSGNMNRHIVCVHKGERNYNCSYCEESFTKAESLKHHEMRHTGEKPHECKICGKRFIQRTALLTHLKTHEKNKRKIDKETTRSVTTVNIEASTLANDLCIS